MKNKVQLIGNIVGFSVKTDKKEGKTAKLTLSTSENLTNEKGEKVVVTEVHRLKGFGRVADIIDKYAVVGREVAIDGKLTHREYEDDLKGFHFETVIVIDEILLIN